LSYNPQGLAANFFSKGYFRSAGLQANGYITGYTPFRERLMIK
jgi:hypothetical protein